MTNPIQHYAWGSHTTIPRFQGREPSGRPEAELWMGAHPTSPSHVEVDGRRRSLIDCIEEAPEGVLGTDVGARFGPRLPYLLKVLAADAPLSLQAHPSEAQALQGFHAEEARGVPIDAPKRNYRDASAKPELLCALTPFDALCGFRDTAASAELLERLGVDRIWPLAATLRQHPPEAALATVMERLLTWPLHDRAALVADVSAAAPRLSTDGAFASGAAWTVRIAAQYPEDPGVVAALLLNLVRLDPGDAIYLPSGTLHAYLRGVGIEVMANSDNVLRGGLTQKHVDIAELQRVLDHNAGPVDLVPARQVADGEVTYPTPAPSFQLFRLNVRPDVALDLDGPGPQVLVCTEGDLGLGDGEEIVSVPAGASAFVPDAVAAATVVGDGVAFRATVPEAALSALP